MNSTIRIVAAVLDTTKLTLYVNDGFTVVLPQGDVRIRRIIDEATPQLLATGSAVVNMAQDVANTYANFEEKSSKVRFFRVAKDKLKNLFRLGSKEEESLPSDLTLGTVPQQAQPAMVSDLELVASSSGNSSRSVDQSVIDEIMTHAVKATDLKFSEEGLDKQAPIKDLATGKTPNEHTPSNSTDTIIAVTSNGRVIPGMERIKSQFERAVKLGSQNGVERFLERIGSVITDRRHSVEDLLKFLERGDLPIAEDGCILIYKVLNRSTFAQYPQAKYVDVHSSKVPQWIGARVMMASTLVDPNRRNECSNGLHVARRGYISNFGGAVCVMAKLAPEDVIAVPEHDANKMRVCGYHIIFELSSEQFSLLKRNRPLTEDAEGRTLLAKALAGQHTRVTHTVEITAQHGGGIKVSTISLPPPAPVPAVIAPIVENGEGYYVEESRREKEAGYTGPKFVPEPNRKKLAPADAIPDDQAAEAFDQPVDPKDVVKEVENLSFKGGAKILVNLILNDPDPKQQCKFWAELLLIKKAAKYGWDRLGVPADLVTRMTEQTETEFPTPKADPTPEPVVTATVSEAEAESFSKRINRLALITPMTEQTATSILNLKKQSKKGWTALKVSDLIAEQVVRLTSAK